MDTGNQGQQEVQDDITPQPKDGKQIGNNISVLELTLKSKYKLGKNLSYYDNNIIIIFILSIIWGLHVTIIGRSTTEQHHRRESISA